jgi:hypothetical protein
MMLLASSLYSLEMQLGVKSNKRQQNFGLEKQLTMHCLAFCSAILG